MDIGFGSPALFLLLAGGFGVATGSAALRRDGPWTLAMAMAFVATAHLAHFPAWMLIWGCTVVAIGIAMALAGVLIRWMSGGDAYRFATIGTLSIMMLLVAHQRHSLPAQTDAFGDRSMALGSALHQQVEILIAG